MPYVQCPTCDSMSITKIVGDRYTCHYCGRTFIYHGRDKIAVWY